MLNTLSEDIKKIMLLGIGAVALTAEKSKDVIDELVKKGELSVEQGKVLNEELKHTIKEKMDEVCAKKADSESVDQKLEKMSKAQLAQLKAKIEALEKAEACERDDKES